MPLAAWTDAVNETFLNIEAWRWAALLGVLVLSLVAGKVVSFLLQRQSRHLRETDRLRALDMFFHSLSGPVTMFALGIGLRLSTTFMQLEQVTLGRPASQPTTAATEPMTFKAFWLGAASTVITFGVAWLIYRLVDLVEYYLMRWAMKTETLLDDQLVPLVRKALRVFVVIVALVFIAQNVFHLQIGPLLAGLGIGGLAFAFAAKDLLANLFGAVVLFTDRPFHLGDRVIIHGYEGYVEEVGFRATRVRTLMGHMLTVPNAILANETIENVSKRPYIKRVLNVTVTYDTAPEKIARAKEILTEMLEAREEHFDPENPFRVFFSDFNADSLNIIVYYYFIPPEWWDYLAFCDEFNTELLRRFNDEGIEFAFPTQTLYLKGGDGEALNVATRDRNSG